ncbi:MAG: hypothetical protein QOD95_2284, partial [Gammaproteobacteria bacterium]|nr:hypothetical protein [Gammaproteobacteria bacterium]
MNELPADVGRVLERLRRDAGPKQSDVAGALGLHPSRISRLETGVAQPAYEEVVEYLKVVGGDAAALYNEILRTRWEGIDRPDPWHPDARALIDAMALLQKLDEKVIADPALPQSLAGQAQFLRSRLLASAAYLSDLTHRFVFIGKIGDGKTTAICFLNGLTRSSSKQPRDLRDECLLATQRSRTTLCEAKVRGEIADRSATSLRFRLAIEPTPNEEIYRLIREWALDLWDRRTGTKRSPDESRSLSIEIERALRNMAKLKTEETKLTDGRVESRREEIEIAKAASSVEELQALLAERLQLFKRTERELVWSGADDAEGRNWLKKAYADINLGNLPTVSLPARTAITVPFEIM